MKADSDGRSASVQAGFVFCSLLALIALAYFYADRQLAAALRPHLAGIEFFSWLTHLVDPLLPLASIFLAALAARGLLRGTFTAAEAALLRVCCAVLIAFVFKEELKW